MEADCAGLPYEFLNRVGTAGALETPVRVAFRFAADDKWYQRCARDAALLGECKAEAERSLEKGTQLLEKTGEPRRRRYDIAVEHAVLYFGRGLYECATNDGLHAESMARRRARKKLHRFH